MSRKDSKGMFAAVLGKLDEEKAMEASAPRSTSPHLMKVAAGVRHMQERSELADRLLKSGEQIVEFDPDSILPSSIPDRFDQSYDLTAIAEIIESMRERGQIVPGLVRPLTGQDGKFQIVYGRRRLAAAKQLGLKFKAAIRELSDEEAVIFQGEENTAREDLSFIEKCLFALAQEQAGYKRETICASLSTGKSHVSEMIKIGSSMPAQLLLSIGKAPGIGRGRWEEFSKRYLLGGATQEVESITAFANFAAASSDDRFTMLLTALPLEEIEHSGQPKMAQKSPVSRSWMPADKSVNVSMKKTLKRATISLEAVDGPRFAEFITDNLENLYEAFRRSEEK
ncbi:plasmid partitioning protein RepB [Paraburkholderia aspalathi]|nr:plasmid partitioning protein RepB [Paraburkholderia aspalathi]